jgi:thiosulfate/3-mercaptopyruvate sulfurtransferase
MPALNKQRLPLLIEPEQLASEIGGPGSTGDTGITIVDLCKPETYAQAHVPGAIHIDYQQIVTAKPPVMGLVPDSDHLSALMSQAGIQSDDSIVVYDDEGGGKAARFIYTLDIIGHKNYSLLNGGLHAWTNEGHPLDSTPNKKTVSNYTTVFDKSPIATRELIQAQLGNPNVQIIDARSPAEYNGSKKFSEKGGHIPGAINLDWVSLMDQHKNLRLKNKDEINSILEELNIALDKPTIVYCQTHHRSALTYFALKNLGMNDIKGYPGSWSEWGNSRDTPIEPSQQ